MFAGVSSSSRATWPNTEIRRRDRRRDSEVRPVRCSTSSYQTRSYHRIPFSCLRHFGWKASRVLTSADSKVQVYAEYSIRDKTSLYIGLQGEFLCIHGELTRQQTFHRADSSAIRARRGRLLTAHETAPTQTTPAHVTDTQTDDTIRYEMLF